MSNGLDKGKLIELVKSLMTELEGDVLPSKDDMFSAMGRKPKMEVVKIEAEPEMEIEGFSNMEEEEEEEDELSLLDKFRSKRG